MSSSCIYKEFAAKLPAEVHGGNNDHFMLISLAGDSNCYTHSGKRARSWYIQSVGSALMIIADAITVSSGFDRGGLFFGNFGSSGSLLPEQYIAKVRRMLKHAHTIGDDGYVNNVRITPKQAGADLIETLKVAVEKGQANYDGKNRIGFYDLLRIEGPTD